MKGLRIILLTALCAWTVHTATAQPRLRVKEYYFGIHGGVKAGTVMFNPSLQYMTPITNACVLGGNGGFVFRYAGHKYCAVQVELNYLHRGWAETNGADKYTRDLHYIELPLLMHLNFGKEHWRGFFNLGPQFGYCVWDNKGKGVQINDYKSQYAPIDHPFDWGLAAGLGFYFRSSNAGLYQLEARFSYSLGGIYGTSLIDFFNVANPMDLSINLAWMWQFKKTRKKKLTNNNQLYENKL